MFKRIMHSMTKCWVYSLVLIPFILLSCKNSGDIGVKIRPGSDSLSVMTFSFPVTTKTIPAGSIYSESDKPVLGLYIDNVYGGFKVDFLSEFRYIRNLRFEKSAESDSLYLVMYYKSFFGDSSSVQEVTVYQLDKKPLDFSENYHSDIDVSEFCSESIVLGSRTYTAYDQTVTAEDRNKSGYCNSVKVKLPQSLLNDMMTRSDIYNSQDDFVNFFKGVYVTNTHGVQTVLEIDSVNLELSYHYPEVLKAKNGGDSIVLRYKKDIFPSNKETTQVIHVQSYTVDIGSKSDSIEIISAPGGTFVEVEIPFEQIYREVVETYQMANDSSLNINYFSLFMELTNLDQHSLRTSPPVYYILVKKNDMKDFFVQSLYPAPNIFTVLGRYSYESHRYTFANAGDYFEDVLLKASRIQDPVERQKYFDSQNPMVIIPVSGVTDIEGTGAVIRHLFDTYGVVVRSGQNKKSPMRMSLTFTSL